MTWTVKASVEEAGKISQGNSKMPGSTFATDAFACKVGSKLAKIDGSVSNKCYARKLQKLRPSVNQGWTKNYLKATKLIADNPERWASAAAFQIARIADKSQEFYHRWFDSGDVYSVPLANKIYQVMQRTPWCNHWLPTKSYKFPKFTSIFKKMNALPNVVARFSSDSITGGIIKGKNTSTIVQKAEDATSKMTVCEAETRGGKCGPCRACWDKNVSF